MSAIIITTAARVNERTRLVPSPSSSSISSYSSSSDEGDSVLHRAPPLCESISKSRFVIVCAGIWSANFVFAFQSSAIPTLAPAIGSGFNHAELASYLGSMFTLANTAVIPIYGVFMETLGRRFAMITGAALYGIGTVMCALSPGMHSLIGARIISGLGGGGMLTVSSVIVTDLVHLRDRGLYQGLMMTVFGSGSMLGGPVAGWLADKYGWPWSFWVQLPITLFCIIIVSIFLPTSPIAPTHDSLLAGLAALDWFGSLLLIGSMTTLILGLSFHTSYLEPWSAPIVWGMLLAAVLCGGLFIHVEGKVKKPVLPLSLLKSSHLGSVMASGFFLSVANQSFLYNIPVYFAVVLGTTTAQAGLILSICGGLGLAIGSLAAGQHIRRGGGYRWLGISSLVPPIGSALIASAWVPATPWWVYWVTVLPCNLGYSTFLCVSLVALVSSVDSKMMPKATAMLYTIRSLGATLGVSIGGSVQLGSLASHLRAEFRDTPNRREIINAILHSKSAIRILPPALRTLAVKAYANSISTVWQFSAVIAVLTLISACFIESREVHGRAKKILKGTGGGVEDAPFGDALGQASIEGER